MTESEWTSCTDPQRMLEFLRGKVSDRKLRLFAVACCRCVECLLQGDYVKGSRTAIEVFEQHVDGLANDQELQTAWGNAAADALDAGNAIAHPAETDYYAIAYAANTVDYSRRVGIAATAQAAAGAIAYDGLSRHANPILDEITGSWRRGLLGTPQWQTDEATVRHLPDYEKALGIEQTNQCRLLHCIFGLIPFHSLPVVDQTWLAWNDGIISALARLIYDDRRFEDMPILADALEEAGCDNADITNHCRQPADHVRGCWVVDLLLGKE